MNQQICRDGDQVYCPICDRRFAFANKLRPLLGVGVCKRCRNKFLSRRQTAYVIDSMMWTFLIGFPLAWVASQGMQSPGASSFGTPVMPLVSPGWMFSSLLGLDSPVSFLSFWVLPLAFFCKDGFSGMSPGRRLTGIRVVDVETRQPISFGASFRRNLVLMVPFGVFIVALTMGKGRRWGDKWANTVVIWNKFAHRLPFDPRGVLCVRCGYDLTGNTSGRCPECFTLIPIIAAIADEESDTPTNSPELTSVPEMK